MNYTELHKTTTSTKNYKNYTRTTLKKHYNIKYQLINHV